MRQKDDPNLDLPSEPGSRASPAPLVAAILAAGLGRRLGGRPKPALHIGGVSLLERLVSALRGAGLNEIGVVIGPYQDTLLPLVNRCGVQALVHDRPDTLLVESQRLAVQNHVDRWPGHDLLLVLADLPLLGAEDIRLLLDAWQQRPATIHAQMPVVNGVRGHPLLLSWSAIQLVAATPSYQGVRDWLNRYPNLVTPLVTQRRAYITDIDTPSDFVALAKQFRPQQLCWPISALG